MSKLIRADFARLWKSRVFWIGMVYSFMIGVLAAVNPYRESLMYQDYNPSFDNFLFTNCMFMPIASAAFVGLFVGTDYSNGTIRNKLIVGHTRIAIYFSNLIVSVAALVIIHLTNIVTVIVIGAPLVGNREMPVDYLITLAVLSIITVVALCAVFLVMSMLITSKANASVEAIILSVILLMAGMMINSRLSEPEYYDAFSVEYYDGETGEMIREINEKERNPLYLTGMKREVYEFLNDFLPGCQLVRISEQNIEESKIPLLPAYSLSITVAATACGVFFFRRKNLN